MNRLRSSLTTAASLIAGLLTLGAGSAPLYAQTAPPPEPPNPFLLVAGSSGAIGFGRVSISSPAPTTRALILQNGGTSPLNVSGLAIVGLQPADFSIVGSTCTTIAAKGFCTITLGFKPTGNGTRSARLVITSDAGGGPHLIPMDGWGLDPSVAQPGVGPIDPRFGYPISYTDGFNSVEICLGNQLSPLDNVTPLCLSPVPDASAAPSLTDDGRPVNFPEEAFYASADATLDIGPIKGLLVLAQEAAFLNGPPAVGDQMTFGRLRIRLRGPGLAAHTWYRFTHPFGVDEFEALPAREGDPDGDIFVTSDIGCFSAPCDFSAALTSRISRFLACANPAPPAGYLGDPAVTCSVTGSPTGFNRFRIQQISGPGGTVLATGISGETDQFTVTGKIASGTPPAPPPTVAVPNVVNLTQVAANAALTGVGLTLGGITTETSATIIAGNVIRQSPLAGATAAVGTAVALVVSSGPPPVIVPNVVNLAQAAAQTAITNAGLVNGAVTTASSATVPSGSVISQNPSAGTSVIGGSAVALVVSSGPAPVAVPNVVNLTQAAATTSITTAGLTLGAVTSENSATVLAGRVIRQNPIAGTSVARGSAVAIVVSLGPATVLVPNVVNLTQAAATTSITNAGLALGAVTSANSATVPAGSVISQNPAAGSSVAPGSAVALVVSLGPIAGTTPTVVASVTTAANVRGNRTVTLTTAVPTVLVAFVSADGPQATGAAGQSVTLSGGGLVWTPVARANAQWGDAEIWTAVAPSPLAGAAITSTLLRHRAGTDYIHMVRIVAFTGVSGIGASNAASGQTVAAASVSITAQASGSVLYAVGEDWSNALTRTFPAGQVQDVQQLGADGDTFWVQRSSAPIAAPGALTFTATTAAQPAPGDRWNLAIVEIKR